MLRVSPLDGEITIEIRETPELDAATISTIDAIWEEARGRCGKTLYDGRLFSLAERDGLRLRGFFVPYRWVVAQRTEPRLYPILGLHPVAVSGLLASPDGIVFGKRARDLAMDAGSWELVPSGGLDGAPLAPRLKLLEELTEETGCPASAVERLREVALIEDNVTHTNEICFELATGLRAGEIAAFHAAATAREYDRIEIVPETALDAFVGGHDVIDVSRALLELR